MTKTFADWWDSLGSGIPPENEQDIEEHTRYVANLAWNYAIYVAEIRKFVILHEHHDPEDDSPLFWSETDGWVTSADATVFTEYESKTLRLPMEAWGWVELPRPEIQSEMANPNT